MEPELIKLVLSVLGGLVSAAAALFFWGVQKVVSQLIELNARVAGIERNTEKIPHLEDATNDHAYRIKRLEDFQGL